LDVVEIDAASNNGVDDIRDLRDEAVYTPSHCKYKVYIVDEVHMLSTSAFNALLKIMEEPPSHVIFILATTEIQKVPATILSRCQRYDFGRIRPEIIEQRLELVAAEEGILLTPEARGLIARLADGALRDALSILDTCASASEEAVDEVLVRRMAGVTDKSYLFALSDAVCAGDATKAILLIAELRERAIDMKRLCEELIHHYRAIMLAGAGAGAVGSGIDAALAERYGNEAKQISLADAVAAMRSLGDCLDRMSRGTDPRIDLELCFFNLCAPAPVQRVMAAPAKAAAPAKQAKSVKEDSDAPPWQMEEAPASATPFAPMRAVPSQKKETARDEALPEDVIPCPFWEEVVALAQQTD
ncbi:MAG: DNA polymerase III subunit gamma/tau, partial [Pygmaiobacter sp.]